MVKNIRVFAAFPRLCALIALLCIPQLIAAQAAPVQDARLAGATREERAGWITARLEGEPKVIGYQYGYLLGPEIDDALRALRISRQHETRKEWSFFRETAQKLFWSKLDPEYQDEITGIAEGLKARGYKYDATDILAENSYIEISDYYLPKLQAQHAGIWKSGAPTSCSAFIATGSMTTGGKIVMAHNFWWDYLMGQRWNVILDIRPTHGHRVMMDTLAGFIHSGSDFAVNSAGIVLCETTISGFKGFDENGVPEFMRMRKSIQYADSLDDLVRIMSKGNNGGYANTWLIGDTKTGEIGKLEMGLKHVIYNHTKDGAYYGANFPEDPDLIKDECEPGAEQSSPARRARWKKLLEEYKGKIDAGKAQEFMADTVNGLNGRKGATMETLCGRGDLGRFGYPAGAANAKVITTELAQSMSFWARMGFPDGSEFSAKEFISKSPRSDWMSPYLHDMKTQPWTLIAPKP